MTGQTPNNSAVIPYAPKARNADEADQLDRLDMPFWGWLAGRLIRQRQTSELHDRRLTSLRISLKPLTTR
jgi:hypothetical protein